MLNREQMVVADKIKELITLLPALGKIERDVADNPHDMENLTNTIFLCRKVGDILKSFSKRIEEIGERAEHDACMRFAQTGSPRYSNEYATISPNPSFVCRYPDNPDKPGFFELLEKVPKNALRIHYPTFQQLVTESLEKMEGVPFGLTKIDGVELKVRVTTKNKKEL